MPGDLKEKEKKKQDRCAWTVDSAEPFPDRASYTKPDQSVYPCCVCECQVSKTCIAQHDHMVAVTGMKLQCRCSDVNDIELFGRGLEKLC